MLPRKIECILSCFDVFGYNSGTSKLSSYKQAAHFIYIAHISVAIFYTIHLIHFTLLYLSLEFQLVELFNSLLQYFAALIEYWFLIIDSVCYRHEHNLFWEYFRKFNNKDVNCFHFLLKLALYISITLFCLLAFILPNGDTTNEFIILHGFLIKLCEIRIFHYIFCVDVLHSQLKIIDHEVETSKYKNTQGIERNTFKWIWIHHNCIYERIGIKC